MKKTFVLLTLLFAFALVLVACGGTTEEAPAEPQEAAPAEQEEAAAPEEEAPAAEEPVELTFSVWGDPEEIEILQEIADDFTAENPNISVTVTVSDWDTYWDKLQTTLAGGNPPDVFAMDAPLYPDYQSRDVLMNLQPMIDRDGFDLTAYYDEALICYDTDEGYYGLPRDIQPSVMYINTDMFDEAGIPYPEDGWTWDDMIDIGQQLTKDTDGDGTTDQYGLWADIWDMELLWGAMIWQFGGEILNEDFTQTLLAEGGAMDAWQTISDMIFENGMMPDPSVAEQFGDPFESGNAAMTPAGHWVVPYYSNVDFNWDAVPLPQAVNQQSMVNSVGFVIAKDSEYPEESWEFLQHLVGEAGQEKITSLGLGVPTLKAIATSDAYLNQPVEINHQVFLDAMEYSRVKPCFRGYDEWGTLIGDGMFSVWIGEAGLQETLDELVPQADAILQDAAE
jgi:multiple sugar transport system substrate-binding protein